MEKTYQIYRYSQDKRQFNVVIRNVFKTTNRTENLYIQCVDKTINIDKHPITSQSRKWINSFFKEMWSHSSKIIQHTLTDRVCMMFEVIETAIERRVSIEIISKRWTTTTSGISVINSIHRHRIARMLSDFRVPLLHQSCEFHVPVV